ncbi:uncharacterized protein DEA37_0011303 [Paragonimus westermani]|uniref:DUF5745 domain-containing protein n=1 Tax=Paragonimus westermani TaxID=34504 RepID=A0A5J4P308_9TREM|nr:uncharacterized protein DEA37_0011303 [Paragonimus westermani]
MTVKHDRLMLSDEVPYPDASCPLHFHENLSAVLCKLSSEIGVELDHIEPREVLKGNRRSVANLLELITAFIAHCVDENLLDFAGVDDAPTNAPKFAEECGGLGDVNLTSHLSTSPELPRCVGRSCMPSSPLQHSLQNNTSVKMTHDSGLQQTNSNDDTTAPSGVLNRDLVDNWPRFVIRQDAMNTTRQECRPSANALPQLPLHRHLSIASIQAGISPPTTPKTVDDFVEIVRHDSPPSAAPSLKSSPVSSKPRRDEPQVGKLDTPALVTGFIDPKQCTTTTSNHVREFNDDRHANPTLSAEGSCIAAAPQLTSLHDHRHRKLYLFVCFRTIFCRAHDEAEAVSRLVQALGQQNNDTLELMHRCLGCRKSTSVSPTVYSNKLEQTLERFVAHVDLLLERLPAVLPMNVHQQHTNVFRQSNRKQRTRGGVPIAGTTRPPVQKPDSDSVHDPEFEGLMDLKHRLMLDALKMCRSELNIRPLSSKSPSEFRCPRCHFVV